jgi:transposase
MTTISSTSINKSFLTEANRSALMEWARSRERKPREGRRAELLLLLDAGFSIRKVAALVKIHPSCVLRWRQQWKTEGFSGLIDKPRSGRKRKLTERQMAEMMDKYQACTKPPPLAYFAQKFQVSRMSISRFLRERQSSLALSCLAEKVPPEEAVISSSSLPLSPSVARAPRAVPQDSSPDVFVKLMNEACECHYKYHQYAEDEARFRNIIELAKKVSEWHPAALRAELNIMYLWHGTNDLESSMPRAKELFSRVNCVKQDDPSVRPIVFETLFYLARICEQHLDFDGAFHWLEKARQELGSFSGSQGGGHSDAMPPAAAKTGYSLIIPHDCHVPLPAYQAMVLAFWGKNLIRRGLIANHPGDVSRGLRFVNTAAKEDNRIQAWEHLAYDTLWQTDALYYLGEDSKIDKCFDTCESLFSDIHGIGRYYLQKSQLCGHNGSLGESENYRQKAIETFQIDFSWIGLAAVYEHDSQPTSYYKWRKGGAHSGAIQRLKMAFLAATLEPSLAHLKNLENRTDEWLRCNVSLNAKTFVPKLAELVLGYEDEFKAIRPLIRTDEERKLLHAGVATATRTLQNKIMGLGA